MRHSTEKLLRIIRKYTKSQLADAVIFCRNKTSSSPCPMWQVEWLAGFLSGFTDLTQADKNYYKYRILFPHQYKFCCFAKIKGKKLQTCRANRAWTKVASQVTSPL